MPLDEIVSPGEPGPDDNGQPIGDQALAAPGLGGLGGLGEGGESIEAPGAFTAGEPVGGPASIFNIMGAPITVLGGVFSGGLPIGGPVTQIFRGGSGPVTPELFISTLTPAGPIGAFFIGAEGAPIGEATFGGGALPIVAPQAIEVRVEVLQPRTALVATEAPLIFGAENGGRGLGQGGAPIG